MIRMGGGLVHPRSVVGPFARRSVTNPEQGDGHVGGLWNFKPRFEVVFACAPDLLLFLSVVPLTGHWSVPCSQVDCLI